MQSTRCIPTLAVSAFIGLFAGFALPVHAADGVTLASSRPVTAGIRLDETLLENKVRVKLLTHLKTADVLYIHVSAEGQNITLSGMLENRADRPLALSLAQSVVGVRHVTDHLSLTPDAYRRGADDPPGVNSDREVANALLEARIEFELLTRIGERALKIYVESQDGVIALSGRVGDSELRDRAVRVARETGGVREVYDLLEVRPAMSGEHDD